MNLDYEAYKRVTMITKGRAALALCLLLFLLSSQAFAEQPKILKIASPAYPPSEMKAGHEGTTSVRVLVDANGNVTSASIHKSSGWPKLDASALDVVKKAKYQAATDAGGSPVPSDGVIPITFDSPYESADSQRAYLERYLSTPCNTYLKVLDDEQLKESQKPGHTLYAFRWPLALTEELLRTEGNSRKANRLVASDRTIYRKFVENCTARPASTTYQEFNSAIDKTL